ncbi:hypothetical protein DFAR_4000017 [Desulfarculales bacterium]
MLTGGGRVTIDSGLEDFVISEGLEESLGAKAEYFEDGLPHLGIKSEDVGIIIHTYLHDHCENDHLCARAKVYARQAEIDCMNAPHPLDHRYDSEYASRYDLVGLSDRVKIAPRVRVLPPPATLRRTVGGSEHQRRWQGAHYRFLLHRG